MKKRTEKQSIDDLFARKLGNMSLPPSADGFERLQARMGQNKFQTRMVFWRNPVTQRYAAAAACLLLVCVIGRLYLRSDSKTNLAGAQIATRQTLPAPSPNAVDKRQKPLADKQTSDVVALNVLRQEANRKQSINAEKKSGNTEENTRSTAQPIDGHNIDLKPESILAQTKPTAGKNKPETIVSEQLVAVDQLTPEPEPNLPAKPAPTTERVLVVTIAEPESLVASRQAAKATVEEKFVVAVASNTEKETKVSGLWQQMKRIKQGEVFAQRENVGNEDRGLLDRAYTGLKHSFDKNKSTRQ